MIKVIYKPGCPFCDVLKAELNKHNVDYITEKGNGIVPRLYLDEKLVFKGMPKKEILHEYIKNRKAA